MATKSERDSTNIERSILIHHDGMRHAPENELGVVFLFSKLARRLGFVEIDRIQPQFPDCWALKAEGDRVRRVWIEFEYQSHGFKTHVAKRQLRGIKPKRGYVVCWDHDWPECERYADVIPLRQELGCGRQVWIQNTRPQYHNALDNASARRVEGWSWAVAQSSRPGDLLLMNRAGSSKEAKRYDADPTLLQSIANIFIVRTPPKRNRTWGWMADVSRVSAIEEPLRFRQLKRDRVLSKAAFVRRQMFGRSNVTAYWYRIYDLIVRQNPEARRALKQFAPETL